MTGITSFYPSACSDNYTASAFSSTNQNQTFGAVNSNTSALTSARRYDVFERSTSSSVIAEMDYSIKYPGFVEPNAGTTKSSTASSSKNVTSPSSKLSSNDRELTDSEYNKLAANLAGIESDIDGNHNCTYEQTLKYGEILARLHKQKITLNTSQEEAAAAAAGVRYKNNKPQLKYVEDCKNYGTALKNLRKASEDVGSDAGMNASEALVGDIVKNYGSLSEALTRKYNNEFENYLRNLEKQYGTQYVFEKIFSR